VPLTVLEIEENTDWAVIELGMSERHQIERLSNIVKPDISIITMIGVSHLSTLGSRKEIAAAKMEIVSGMKDGGLLIYYGDEKLLENEINALPKKHSVSEKVIPMIIMRSQFKATLTDLHLR
jgi:UDP-N-acetylmuramoyl-tripeptide--D-alanyl-D-alanine ligase